jgi:hypothetical protein
METESLIAGTGTPGQTAASSPSRMRRYLCWFAGTGAVYFLLPLVLLRLPSFERWGGTIYGPAMDFGYRTAGMNADVVLFGDSAVLYGVNPSLISRQLGLKVVNLPSTAGSLHVTDDLVLQRYLQNNRPPRLIVFYFPPWELDYHAEPSQALFEGEEMLLRHGTLRQIAAFTRKEPSILQFPLQFYVNSPKVALMAALRHQDRTTSIETTMGHMDTQVSRTHLTRPCMIPQRFVDPSGIASVEELAARYRSPARRILIFLAPIPACGNASELIGRTYDRVPAAPPREMSPELYLADPYYIHLDPSAVPAASKALAEAIRDDLASDSLRSRHE